MNEGENWEYANYIKEEKCKFPSPIAIDADPLPVHSNKEVYS